MYGFDWTIILIIPAALIAMYAQYKVSSTFQKYSTVANGHGYSGAQVAAQLLAAAGINDVRIEHIKGNLTDHYDPRGKVLRLSDAVYGSKSLAAIGVAAHETGHAVQHNKGYAPLNLRSGIFPIVSISSKVSGPLIMIGILLSSGSGDIGYFLLQLGILLFTATVVFQLITLPVEFNASSRAIKMLSDNGLLTPGELGPARQVLNAAAMTYVAAAITAIANLLRFILIANRRRK